MSSLKEMSVEDKRKYGSLISNTKKEMEKLPKDYEMSKIILSDDLPDNLTYLDTFKLYFKTVKEFRNYRYISAIHESMLDADN